MAEIMYMVSTYGLNIESVKVVKKTKSFVTFEHEWCGNITETKRAASNFYQTWEEARDALVARIRESVRQAQSTLDQRKEMLRKASQLSKHSKEQSNV